MSNNRIPRVLIIEDDTSTAHYLKKIFEAQGWQSSAVESGKDAKIELKSCNYNAIIMDYNLKDTNGLELTAFAKTNYPNIPILMFSGYDSGMIEFGNVLARPDGFILKGADLSVIINAVSKVLSKSKANNGKVTADDTLSKILGVSDAVKKLKDEILKYSWSNSPVLILGPNGAGKEMVAKAIMENSRRNKCPYIIDNAAVCPETLVDSKYFGCAKGSHSEAKNDIPGLFDSANTGTLFIDEIGNMPLSTQEKLLRAIEYQVITPVGATKEKKINVRIIAATNKILEREIQNERFMLDLFHRLNVLAITVPSLNERLDDIPILADFFISQICKEEEVELKMLNKSALELLQSHQWTGNIRELSNVLRRAILTAGRNADVLLPENFNLLNHIQPKALYIPL